MPRRTTGSLTRRRAKSAPAASSTGKSPPSDGPDTAFVDALSADFLRHGAPAIAKLRENDPVTYMKLCASVLPKSVIDSIDPLDSLTDEELHERARHLAAKAGLGPDPDADRAGAAKKP